MNELANAAAINALSARVTDLDSRVSINIAALATRLHDTGVQVEPEPATTRLKMRVNGKSESNVADNPLTHLSLAAVQSVDAASENHVFGKYTPCGNLSFSVIPEVADKFSVGDEVYLDLSLAVRR